MFKSSPITSPTVSVIIPTYQRLETLPRAIDSVLSQSFNDFELIVVDDGSSDGTAEYLKQLQEKEPRLRVIQQENHGVSAARNHAIEVANGKWLAFLDSDDEWLAKKLQMQMELAQIRPELKIIHGEEIWIRRGRRVNPHKKHKKFGGRVFRHCLALCLISPSAVIINKEIFQKIGSFNEDYVVCEDYDLWLRITAQYDVGFIEEPIIKKYGGHSDQLSTKYFAMDYWRVKSLSQLIDSPHISENEQTLLLQTIIEKSTILLNGYKKHENLENYDEIDKLSQRAQAFSTAQSDINR